jgi:hypothetical protein|nr:MAG TPA: terminase large subunit [Caudoviricetes sp.]
MFRQFTNNNGYFIGVDLADRKGDLSVATIMKKRTDGAIEIVDCSVIGRDMTPAQQEQKFKEYERLCNQKAVKQEST